MRSLTLLAQPRAAVLRSACTSALVRPWRGENYRLCGAHGGASAGAQEKPVRGPGSEGDEAWLPPPPRKGNRRPRDQGQPGSLWADDIGKSQLVGVLYRDQVKAVAIHHPKLKMRGRAHSDVRSDFMAKIHALLEILNFFSKRLLGNLLKESIYNIESG